MEPISENKVVVDQSRLLRGINHNRLRKTVVIEKNSRNLRHSAIKKSSMRQKTKAYITFLKCHHDESQDKQTNKHPCMN
jgi:hypothetical protein